MNSGKKAHFLVNKVQKKCKVVNEQCTGTVTFLNEQRKAKFSNLIKKITKKVFLNTRKSAQFSVWVLGKSGCFSEKEVARYMGED